MQERIGNVTITYSREAAALEEDRMEDAKIRELLEAGYDCRRGTERSWPVLYHLSHLRGNLTEWLPVGKEQSVLEIGADSGQLTGGFLKKAGRVVCLEKSVSRSRMLALRYQEASNLEVHAGRLPELLDALEGQRFDWVVASGVLSETQNCFPEAHAREQALRILRKYLKSEGHLVLAEDNRFGLKYWAGAMEPHTGRYFDSLEGRGDGVSRGELEQLLKHSGFEAYQFYYPYPERWFPSAIYSDDWLPRTGELNRNLRNFEGERLVLFDEEKVYDQLIQDGRFPEFANAFLVVAGPEFAEQTVFVKYSNDRAEEFMIRTDIVKMQKGMEVRKIPVSGEAAGHVRQMKHWEGILDQQYRKNGLRANRCELRGDTACFEFLQGKTYEQKLDELRERKEYGALAEALQHYRRLLTDTLSPEWKIFEKSQTFVEMFGNPEFFRSYRGAEINNLDWIFGNLMETEEGIQIIDYEWTFRVQVPSEYLIWRAVSLYQHDREDLKALGLMVQLGISPEEELLFEEMEQHFQRWLLQGTVTIGEQYLATAGRTIGLDQMLAGERKKRMQIYVDTGAGFSEQESWWVDTEPDKQGEIHMELLLPRGTRSLRIDPAECCCLVKVKRLAGELGGSYPLSCTHNGRELEEQGILYTTGDPQLVIPAIVEGTGRIWIELTVECLHPDTAHACMNLLNRVRSAERIYRSLPFRLLKRMKKLLGR